MNRARDLALLLSCLVPACATQGDGDGWQPLLHDGTLEGWQPTAFGGEGEVTLQDGVLTLGMGNPLTGVTFGGDFPATDYEIALQAARQLGDDFFCALTFPLAGDHATLVVGGWGGTLVGLSCIDGRDAARNETARRMGFDRGRFYEIRLRVRGRRVTGLIDGAIVLDLDLAGREVGLRPEVELSAPLGICSFATRAALRDLRWRRL